MQTKNEATKFEPHLQAACIAAAATLVAARLGAETLTSHDDNPAAQMFGTRIATSDQLAAATASLAKKIAAEFLKN
jgi:hypothetical protein